MVEDGFDVQSKSTQGTASFSSSYFDAFSTGSSVPVPQLNSHVSQVRDWISGNIFARGLLRVLGTVVIAQGQH